MLRWAPSRALQVQLSRDNNCSTYRPVSTAAASNQAINGSKHPENIYKEVCQQCPVTTVLPAPAVGSHFPHPTPRFRTRTYQTTSAYIHVLSGRIIRPANIDV
jgi:cytochrome c5